MNIKMSKVVSSAIVGNALEAYDLTVYGFFATVIAAHFFPKQDKLTGIANVFGIFFIGYLARPLGAIFFGRMGNRFGRKPALLISIWLMALSTFFLGLLPNYSMIGVWAPLLLLFIRVLQGFSCGGELTGSIIFTVEHAPPAQRGFYGSFANTGFYLGLLLASFAAWLVHHNFSNAAVVDWAWRLPFLVALLGGFVGWYVRRRISETALFLDNHRLVDTYFALRRNYAKQLRPAIMIIGIKIFSSISAYLFYVYMVTFMSSFLHYTHQQALNINIISIILLVLLIPWMGKLSDHIGRRPVLAFAIIGSVLWAWPYFWLLQQNDMALALVAQLVMTLFAAAYAVYMVTIVEIVPVQWRFTVVAVAHAVEASLFSGTVPFVASLLINATHSPISLVVYLSVCALISLITVYKVRETKYRPSVSN